MVIVYVLLIHLAGAASSPPCPPLGPTVSALQSLNNSTLRNPFVSDDASASTESRNSSFTGQERPDSSPNRENWIVEENCPGGACLVFRPRTAADPRTTNVIRWGRDHSDLRERAVTYHTAGIEGSFPTGFVGISISEDTAVLRVGLIDGSDHLYRITREPGGFLLTPMRSSDGIVRLRVLNPFIAEMPLDQILSRGDVSNDLVIEGSPIGAGTFRTRPFRRHESDRHVR